MEECGVEESRVALGQRQLHVMLVEIGREGGRCHGEVTGLVGLRIGQVERRPALQRHVAMRDGALQRERGRQAVHMRRVALHHRGSLEAEMIVAMRGLRRAARIHHVDLRRHLVGRAEPGLRDQGEHRIAVVAREDLRLAQAELFEGVPDAVIRARLGEVVAAAGMVRVLLGDDGAERVARGVDRRHIGEGAAQHDDAGTGHHRLSPFGEEGAAGFGHGRRRSHSVAIVDENLRGDLGGEGIILRPRFVRQKGCEVIEPGAVLGEEDAISAQWGKIVGFHGDVPWFVSAYSIEAFAWTSSAGIPQKPLNDPWFKSAPDVA